MVSTYQEIDNLREYISRQTSENAKRDLVYPFFRKLFKDKFKYESDAAGADLYIEGQLVVELKTSNKDWLSGFYQALHYAKKGLSYPSICVISEKFLALWKIKDIPEAAKIYAHTSDALKSASETGKTNAKRTDKTLEREILKSAFFKFIPSDLELAGKSVTIELYEFKKIINNLDAQRIMVDTHNFIDTIALMEKFFETPIEAIHAFYTIVGYWDVSATAAELNDEIRVIGYRGSKFSEAVKTLPRMKDEFKKFVESRFVFTNEGSGLTADYYFSRFDEVITRLMPEYARQHGIFFTDINLSKFALWYVHAYYEDKLSDKYVVFDPAGGSGNLVSSWRGHLRHKIVSELQPDLLRTIEMRMRVDPYHLDTGFTIIPKTSENRGLNFISMSAEEYYAELKTVLREKQIPLDKPLAFLLNPPYKNTDENVKARENTGAEYDIDPEILKLTGADAGKERYLAFLAQIIRMSQKQVEENPEMKPLLMIFTPTSWLIPRPTYTAFRKEFDKYFRYEEGFIVTSNEYFKLAGKWPVAFTIWSYNYNEEGNKNNVKVKDFTFLKKADLNINWNEDQKTTNNWLKEYNKKAKTLKLDNSRGDIRKTLPFIKDKKGNKIRQSRYNIYRNKTKDEEGKSIISGFPLKDDRHQRVKAPHGFIDGNLIGFMDDATPVRLKQDTLERMSNLPDRVWFYLDNRIQKINLAKIFNGPADNRSYCAYDLESAKATFLWFAISKAINGRYPLWVNMYDLWPPKIKPEFEAYYYSLCFAFALAENRCVVTKFEADNPVPGTPEVFVDNPLCPTNPDAFWSTTLDAEIVNADKDLPGFQEPGRSVEAANPAIALVNKIKELYRFWNMNYCKGQFIYNTGLEYEPYFRYFFYPDFLTPRSGLIQIRKFATIHADMALLQHFSEISTLTAVVKEEIYKLMVEEFGYFE